MTKKEFITERTRIVSEMLDNPGECEIYPTSKCFEEFDTLFDTLGARIQELEEVYKAAKNLYDNRLGWSGGRNPYAPKELWENLRKALR